MCSGLGDLRIYVRLNDRDCSVIAPPCGDEWWDDYFWLVGIPVPVTVAVLVGFLSVRVAVVLAAAISITGIFVTDIFS